jgi:hypothetical protein
MTCYGYPNLCVKYGWKPGVYRAPTGYAHPWLAVTAAGTSGHWTREQAREAYRLAQTEYRLNPDDATTYG